LVAQLIRFHNRTLWLDIQSLAYYDAFNTFRVYYDNNIH